MKKINLTVLAFATLLTQSCCVYHSSTISKKGKTSEFGIAPYNTRPLSKEEAKNDKLGK